MRSNRLGMLLAMTLALSSCASNQGWFALHWIEKPAVQGPSQKASPQDQTEFRQLLSYDRKLGPDAFEEAKRQIEAGDVIAYRLGKWEARRDILLGQFNKIGYRLFRYGHLAIAVQDPEDPTQLRIFSSESFKGANLREDLDSLKTHDWDVYRLDKRERLNWPRLNEFVQTSLHKAGKWNGYDFTGMFGVWNSNLRPAQPDDIGSEYICSTVVVTGLYYAGLELDAIKRRAIDLVTPQQVVSSRGHFIPLPEMTLEAVPLTQEPKPIAVDLATITE